MLQANAVKTNSNNSMASVSCICENVIGELLCINLI